MAWRSSTDDTLWAEPMVDYACYKYSYSAAGLINRLLRCLGRVTQDLGRSQCLAMSRGSKGAILALSVAAEDGLHCTRDPQVEHSFVDLRQLPERQGCSG
jgi:hypothetical protein